MNIPAYIFSGRAVFMMNPSEGGVMTARFRGLEKKSQADSSGMGSD
jgi:hypothetical protein